ncbi:MAG: acyltransferase [Lachnospiraceae bacterium]|nr:acyltransferase [Lachnospiraceae bacterium]
MQATKRVQWIESCRGIFCCMILAAHIIATNETYGIYANGCGKIGVWGFMILSGYFAMRPYMESGDGVCGKQILCYYKNRALKIIPVYLCALIVEFLVGMLPSWTSVPLHLVTAQGIGHFWYMAVILRFYAVFPVFLILRKLIRPHRIYVLLLAAILVCAAVLFPYTGYVENSIRLYWYLPVFLMGMILAFAADLRQAAPGRRTADIAAAGLLCVVACMTPPLRQLLFGIEPGSWLQNKYLYLGVIWAVMFVLIRESRHIRIVLENNRVLRFLGEISFELYLLHYPILHGICVNIRNMPLCSIVTAALSIVCACILRLLLKKGRYIIRRTA